MSDVFNKNEPIAETARRLLDEIDVADLESTNMGKAVIFCMLLLVNLTKHIEKE
jgi:hypothetical protein